MGKLNITSFLKAIIILFVMSLSVMMVSCEDLPLQKSVEYKGEAIDPNLNMTTWEFLSSRSDFSLFKELIDSAGMRVYYEQTDVKYTFLLVQNIKMEKFLTKYTNGIAGMPLDKREMFVRYHIIDGEYSGLDSQIPTNYIFVTTLLKGEGGLMTLKMYKNPSLLYVDYANDNMIMLSGSILVNPYSTNGTSTQRPAITSNIKSTNGIIHVLKDYAYYTNTPSFPALY